jgi:hypothetical protein
MRKRAVVSSILTGGYACNVMLVALRDVQLSRLYAPCGSGQSSVTPPQKTAGSSIFFTDRRLFVTMHQ